MQQAIEKADVLIEALGWIRALRDKVTVIKLGGSVMEDETALAHLLLDVVFMETVGMRPVIVHGGRGRHQSCHGGWRGFPRSSWRDAAVTDAARAGASSSGSWLERSMKKLPIKSKSWAAARCRLNFQSSNVLFGQTSRLEDQCGAAGRFGLCGREVTRVERSVIENFCYAGTVPVIPSMCLDVEEGETQKYNVNADTAARAVAEALGPKSWSSSAT